MELIDKTLWYQVWALHFLWSHRPRATSIIWWMILSIRWWWRPIRTPRTPRIIIWRRRSHTIISPKIRFMAVIARHPVRWIFRRRSRHSHNLMLKICLKGRSWDLMKQMWIINLMYTARFIIWYQSLILMKVLLLYSLDMIIIWIWMLKTS